MALFVRCEWMPAPSATLEERVTEAAAVVRSVASDSPYASAGWFLTARSRKAALAKPVDLERLSSLENHWRRVPLVVEGAAYYALSMWDGKADLETTGLSVGVYDPPAEADQLVISGPTTDAFRACVSWREVLALAESLALRLGGLTVVGSYALHLYAEPKGIPDAMYAAYWGVDRSERSPFYARLRAAGHEPPWSVVSSATWEEVLDPSLGSLASFTESARLLAERT